jgi:hypothetical protein
VTRASLALTVGALSTTWVLVVLIVGGTDTSILGIRLRATGDSRLPPRSHKSGRPTAASTCTSPFTDLPALSSIAPWIETEYDLAFVQTVVAEDDRANIYDRQDEFFQPFAGFHPVERPGPNLRIFVRRADVLLFDHTEAITGPRDGCSSSGCMVDATIWLAPLLGL